MSLVNDALKRAREAQQQAPVSNLSGPQLRPAEPAPPTRHGVGMMLPVALGIVAVLILFLVWRFSQQGGSTGPSAPRPEFVVENSSVRAPATPAVESKDAGENSAQPPAARKVQEGGALNPISPAPALPKESKAQASSTTNPPAPAVAVPPGTAPVSTNAAGLADVVPPKPAPPKLQAIIFNPSKPSVVISGKALFIGERFGEFRVAAIDQESATLVGAGQTNVLTLGH
jgi:cytoskeletal protein RodZ